MDQTEEEHRSASQKSERETREHFVRSDDTVTLIRQALARQDRILEAVSDNGNTLASSLAALAATQASHASLITILGSHQSAMTETMNKLEVTMAQLSATANTVKQFIVIAIPIVGLLFTAIGILLGNHLVKIP